MRDQVAVVMLLPFNITMCVFNQFVYTSGALVREDALETAGMVTSGGGTSPRLQLIPNQRLGFVGNTARNTVPLHWCTQIDQHTHSDVKRCCSNMTTATCFISAHQSPLVSSPLPFGPGLVRGGWRGRGALDGAYPLVRRQPDVVDAICTVSTVWCSVGRT